MRRLFVVAVLFAALAVTVAPADAEPGKAKGGGWFTSTQLCDGEEVTISGHAGVWSAAYSPDDGRHFILVSQQIINLETGEVLFDLRKQGHSNQGPFTTCEFELPIDFFGFRASVVAEGFWCP